MEDGRVLRSSAQKLHFQLHREHAPQEERGNPGVRLAHADLEPVVDDQEEQRDEGQAGEGR